MSISVRFDELKAMHLLPSPTGAALALLRLGESDKTSTQDIARIIQSDPAVCGRLLKLANSASLGRGRPVTSISEAVIQLGLRPVRDIALGFSLVSQNSQGPCGAFDYTSFWSHSLAMGIAAQACARYARGIVPTEAFTFGLLAQVGRLALACIYPDLYSTILAQVSSKNPNDVRQGEVQCFALDHSQLTGAMLRDWGLPDECVLAVESYDNPDADNSSLSKRTQIVIRLLQTASLMADTCLADELSRSDAMLKLVADAEYLGLDSEKLLAMCDQVVEDWREWGGILQIETAAVPPFAELLERAKMESQGVELSDDTARAPANRPLTIVVVDDDAVALLALTRQLAKAGHAVHRAKNGTEGLQIVFEVAPQLVITDFHMPGMDGPSLIRALRQTKLGRQMFVIMMTSGETDATLVEAFAAGADDYFVKPVSARVLEARLGACARVIHLQDEVQRDREELQRYMTELGIANRKLQKAAMTDALTGLFNRRYAMDCLEKEWAESVRRRAPLACMVIDIDHFKKVNDTHGHDAGDLVLQKTAQMLCSRMRPTDAICRLGGEEFLVIGANMNENTALECAERLRAGVENQRIVLSEGHLHVSVSIGVSIRTDSVKGTSELLKKADNAVYQAKAAGRNRVCF